MDNQSADVIDDDDFFKTWGRAPGMQSSFKDAVAQATSIAQNIEHDQEYQAAVEAVAAEIDPHGYEYTWCCMCGYAEPDFMEMKCCPRCGIRNSADRDGTLENYAYLNNSGMPICLRCSHSGIGHRFIQPTVQRCGNKDFRCDCDHYEPSDEERETHADGMSNLPGLADFYPIHVDQLPGWHPGLELTNPLNVTTPDESNEPRYHPTPEPPGWKPHWRVKPH
jgi:hypothetical protein